MLSLAKSLGWATPVSVLPTVLLSITVIENTLKERILFSDFLNNAIEDALSVSTPGKVKGIVS